MLRKNTVMVDKVGVKGEEVGDVVEFVYLDAKVSKDGGGTDPENIRNRQKTKGAFQNLTKLWNSTGSEHNSSTNSSTPL